MKAKNFMTPLRRYSEADGQNAAGFVAATGISVPEDASIFRCIDCLLKHNVSRLRVVDKDKKVVGILQGQEVFSNIMLIALVGVLLLALWSMRGAIILPDPATFIW